MLAAFQTADGGVRSARSVSCCSQISNRGLGALFGGEFDLGGAGWQEGDLHLDLAVGVADGARGWPARTPKWC
jgi:hypothetical protein